MVIQRACLEDSAEPKLIHGDPVTPRIDSELRQASLTGLPPRPRPVLPEQGTDAALPAGISDTRQWTEEEIWNALEKLKETVLDWKKATPSSRKWWQSFEEELRNRQATITEFYLAYVCSNTDNIQANLYYLDYKRLKEAEDDDLKS